MESTRKIVKDSVFFFFWSTTAVNGERRRSLGLTWREVRVRVRRVEREARGAWREARVRVRRVDA